MAALGEELAAEELRRRPVPGPAARTGRRRGHPRRDLPRVLHRKVTLFLSGFLTLSRCPLFHVKQLKAREGLFHVKRFALCYENNPMQSRIGEANRVFEERGDDAYALLRSRSREGGRDGGATRDCGLCVACRRFGTEASSGGIRVGSSPSPLKSGRGAQLRKASIAWKRSTRSLGQLFHVKQILSPSRQTVSRETPFGFRPPAIKAPIESAEADSDRVRRNCRSEAVTPAARPRARRRGWAPRPPW